MVVFVALSGAFTFFIIQAFMATYSMCSTVKSGLTTAATGMSYMGLWTVMVHACQWGKSLVGLAPGFLPLADSAHRLILDSMGFGSQQLVVQPTPLPFPGMGPVDASQFTPIIGAVI